MTNPKSLARAGWSLIELIGVLVLLGFLAGLLLPAVLQARQQNDRRLCENRLRTLGLAVHNVNATKETDGKEFPFTLAHIDALDAKLDELPDVKLVIIDPVSAFIPSGVDDHKDADVRALEAAIERVQRELDGAYHLSPSADSADVTEIVYELSIDLIVPIPGFVKRRAENRIIKTALDQLKQRVESTVASD